jgi:hypothetical protein
MGRYDGDIDILAEVVEEAEEALKGKVLEVAAEKQGDFGLGSEWARGIAPLASLRTVREPLDSHRSH